MSERYYRHRSAVTIAQAITATSVVVALIAGMVLAIEILLILFLGILFGVFLSKSAGQISSLSRVGYRTSLAIVIATLLVAGVGGTASFFVQIERQIERTDEQIRSGIEQLKEIADRYPSIKSAAASIPFVSDSGFAESGDDKADAFSDAKSSSETDQSQRRGDQPADSRSSKGQDTASFEDVPEPFRRAIGAIGQMLQTTFGLIVNSLLIFFVGLFLAVSPQHYRDGLAALVPRHRRPRAIEVLNQLGDSLWHWLIGRFGSMFVTGLGAFVVLAAIGVPLAGTLGVITGLLTFIPNIGAAIALLLAMLCALPQGTTAVVMVLIGFLVLQLVESYVVTPLIQQRQVSLPPALLISFQAVMGAMFGFLGAVVASPILAAGKKATELLYIQDFLGDDEYLHAANREG